MTGSEPQADEVFEIDRIRQLIELMEQHGLSEIDLRREDQRIRLRRGPEETAAVPVAAPIATQAAVAAVPATPAPVVESGQRAEDDANIVFIKSPMVGTFYGRPNPEADAFVKVGQSISADSTVCIIEAMKLMNEIEAEVSGTLVACLADDGQPVEFDQPIFRIRPD